MISKTVLLKGNPVSEIFLKKFDNSLAQSLDEKECEWFSLSSIDHFNNDEGRLVLSKLAQNWEFMQNPSSDCEVSIPLDKHVIFFGGSFNPWHNGHSECIRLLDKPKNVFIIPDHNPQKQVGISHCVWKKYQSLLVQTPKDIPVYPGFWAKDAINPTVNWLPAIKDNFPELKVSLLLGFDSFLTLHRWIEASRLINALESIYIVSRNDDDDLKQVQIETLRQFYPHLIIHFLGHHQYEGVSSTSLRQSNKTENKGS